MKNAGLICKGRGIFSHPKTHSKMAQKDEKGKQAVKSLHRRSSRPSRRFLCLYPRQSTAPRGPLPQGYQPSCDSLYHEPQQNLQRPTTSNKHTSSYCRSPRCTEAHWYIFPLITTCSMSCLNLLKLFFFLTVTLPCLLSSASGFFLLLVCSGEAAGHLHQSESALTLRTARLTGGLSVLLDLKVLINSLVSDTFEKVCSGSLSRASSFSSDP